MNPVLRYKLRVLGEFISITAIAGIVYQLIDLKYVNHMGILMGAILGFRF